MRADDVLYPLLSELRAIDIAILVETVRKQDEDVAGKEVDNNGGLQLGERHRSKREARRHIRRARSRRGPIVQDRRLAAAVKAEPVRGRIEKPDECGDETVGGKRCREAVVDLHGFGGCVLLWLGPGEVVRCRPRKPPLGRSLSPHERVDPLVRRRIDAFPAKVV